MTIVTVVIDIAVVVHVVGDVVTVWLVLMLIIHAATVADAIDVAAVCMCMRMIVDSSYPWNSVIGHRRR